jgi:hypothetical protein
MWKDLPILGIAPFFCYSSKKGYKTLSAIVSQASKLIAKLENSPTSK